MDKLLYSYAIVKSLYERFGDYIDTFNIFVIKVLPSNKSSINLKSIQEKIQDTSGLFIPEFSLRSIITRARKSGYVSERAGYVSLTDKGDRLLERLEPESEVTRRINKLLESIKIYFNDKRLALEEVYRILVCFINENFEPIIEFFDPSGKCILSTQKINHKYEEKLVEYFKIIDQKEPELYKTLQDIVYGSVISLSLVYSNIAEINKKFRDVKVFLDSNFIFSLFELHYSEVDDPVKELFELLKKHKFDLKVFDFTIQEMVHVLGSFISEQHMYIPGIRVNSIYSNLKDKNWTVEDVKDFIRKIEEKIWNLGIEIYPSNIDLDIYSPPKDYIDKIQKYKPLLPNQSERTYCHDLAAVEKIREIRGGLRRELEKSSAIFLTSDLRLSRFNFLEFRHKESFTICEIIPDRLLTNILWLKNPQMIKEIALSSIIAIHSKGIFIDQKIWRRFYFNVKKLKEEKHITDRDIATLFYSGHIEEVLLGLDDADIMKITPNLIEEEIRYAKEKIESEIQAKVENQKIVFEKQITGEIEKQRKWENKLKTIKTRIENTSRRKAAQIINGEIIMFYSIILVIFIVVFRTSPRIIFVASPIISILGFLGLRFNILYIKSKSMDRKFNLIYQRELRKFNLEDENSKNSITAP